MDRSCLKHTRFLVVEVSTLHTEWASKVVPCATRPASQDSPSHRERPLYWIFLSHQMIAILATWIESKNQGFTCALIIKFTEAT